MLALNGYQFKPPILKGILNRPRLYRYLTDRRIVLIVGKAGQGKSTLAAEFLKNERKKYLWYNFDKTDRDAKNFISKLSYGLRQILNNTGLNNKDNSKEIDIITESDNDNIWNILIKESKKVYLNDYYLILDNFHILTGAEDTCSTVSGLMRGLPENMHIIILSRFYPKLSLSRIRSEKELTEITNEDLAFTQQEVFDLFVNIYKFNFEHALIERISDILLGWITPAVYLIEKLNHPTNTDKNLLLEAFSDNLSLPELDDFFNTEIFNNISQDDRDSLIKLAPVTNFAPELIERITEKDGMNFLTKLLNMNLFVEPVDISNYIYKFHPLFRTFLNKIFEKIYKKQAQNIFHNIAEYYCDENNFEKTIHFLSLSGNYSRAKNVLMKNAEELIRTGKYEKIKYLLNNFPEEMVLADKDLSFYEAVASNLSQPFTAREKLSQLLKYFEAVRDYNKQAWIYSVLLTNYFFYQTGHEIVSEIVRKSEEFLQTAEKQLNPERRELLKALIPLGKWWIEPLRVKAFEVALRAEETSYKIHYTEAILCSRLVLTKIYLARGEFHEAENILKSTNKLFKQNEDFRLYRHYESLLSFYLGDTYFYLGELENAITKVQKAINNSSKDFAFLPYLKLNLILYNLYLENYEKAEQLFNTIQDSYTGENLYLKYYLLYLLKMLIAYRNGNKRLVEYYSRRLLEKENEPLLRTDFPYSYVGLGEMHIYTEDFNTAKTILTNFIKETNKNDFPYSYATAYGLLGYIAYKQNNSKSKSYFNTMALIVKERKYTNLDICSPELLRDIATISKNKIFKTFPRLQNLSDSTEHVESIFPMEIQTLGNFKVFIRGNEVNEYLLNGQRRVIDLLKLLIVNRNKTVMKEKIYEMFWPGYSYKSARDNLNTIIYRLRKIFNDKIDFLETDTNAIRFKKNMVITDVDRFLDFIKHAKNAMEKYDYFSASRFYKEAILLYRGDFIESDLYNDFIRDERENLKGLYKTALFNLTKIYLSSGEYMKALEWAKKLVEADPLCESAYRLLMIAAALVGNRSEIPRLFNKLNTKLQSYYKISADNKTIELKNKLLSGIVPEESMWKNETIV
ncbi:MAG: hypothetical protein DRP57_08085 [Spirochaetes bacterium]|nr:MAG: hypothetical protein DRP57_08085 [Spirochaetota bacterium]